MHLSGRQALLDLLPWKAQKWSLGLRVYIILTLDRGGKLNIKGSQTQVHITKSVAEHGFWGSHWDRAYCSSFFFFFLIDYLGISYHEPQLCSPPSLPMPLHDSPPPKKNSTLCCSCIQWSMVKFLMASPPGRMGLSPPASVPEAMS